MVLLSPSHLYFQLDPFHLYTRYFQSDQSDQLSPSALWNQSNPLSQSFQSILYYPFYQYFRYYP